MCQSKADGGKRCSGKGRGSGPEVAVGADGEAAAVAYGTGRAIGGDKIVSTGDAPMAGANDAADPPAQRLPPAFTVTASAVSYGDEDAVAGDRIAVFHDGPGKGKPGKKGKKNRRGGQ